MIAALTLSSVFTARFRRRRAGDHEAVTSRGRHAGHAVETARLRLGPGRPRHERGRDVRPGHMRKRIAAADPGVEVEDMAGGRGHQHVAIEDTDMPKALADPPPELLESRIPNRHRAIGLARPHPELALDEGAHVAALEIVH